MSTINTIYEFICDKSVDLIWLVILFFTVKILLKAGVKRLTKISDAVKEKIKEDQQRRATTINKIIYDNGKLAIDVVFIILLLAVFGLDIRPVLAGLGVIGLAVGFGAQSLIKDFVSGLFILIENQYNIGDEVQIGSSIGKVAKITLRSTILEDKENKTYYIANGSINTVINLSQKK